MEQIPVYTSWNRVLGKKPTSHSKKAIWAFISPEDAEMLDSIHRLIDNDQKALVRLTRDGRIKVIEASKH